MTTSEHSEQGQPLAVPLSDQLGLVERLRLMSRRGHWPLLGDEAADEIERLRATLAYAEAALADIGDADREPGDDLAWCESRAAEALPRVRAHLGA